MATRLYLLAALLVPLMSLMSAGAAASSDNPAASDDPTTSDDPTALDDPIASENPSGLWNISYEVQWGNPGDLLARSSVASIYEKGSTLLGEASLENRSDGSLIGILSGRNFDAAITFRQKPTIFVRLKGDCIGNSLQGSFSASSTNGRFWRGCFTALQARSGVMPEHEVEIESLEYMTEGTTAAPAPIVFIEPEAFYYEQEGKAERKMFAINYSRNTILMCRNVPMIWQWWL